jgi:hypothetical protein
MSNPSTSLRERLIFQDVSVQVSAVAGVDPATTSLIAAKDEHTIVLRKITCIITTAAAKFWSFRTSNGTPVVLALLEASKDEGQYVFEFGEKGYTIPENEALVLATDGAGVAGIIIVDAHRRPAVGRALLPSQL